MIDIPTDNLIRREEDEEPDITITFKTILGLNGFGNKVLNNNSMTSRFIKSIPLESYFGHKKLILNLIL